jgi:hypothetical protein
MYICSSLKEVQSMQEVRYTTTSSSTEKFNIKSEQFLDLKFLGLAKFLEENKRAKEF